MKSKIIPLEISEKILTIGPGDYLAYSGGMGYVLNTYYNNFETFNYLKAHEHKYHKAKWPLIKFFTGQLFKFIGILLSNKKIKILHIHGAAYGSFYRKYILFYIGKFIFRKKVIYHVHGSEFSKFYMESGGFTKRLVKHFVENADLLICLSLSWKTFFTTNFKRIKKIEILKNGIEKPAIAINQLVQARMGAPKITFLFLGALGDRKGVFDLLNAAVIYKAYFTGKITIVIGGNGEVERLKDYIKNNELDEIVHFEGWVSGDKKADLLKSSSVYILPTYNEGLPIAILEAMSYALPIISTPVGGIPEIVLNENNGFLINPGDTEAIFQALKKFIDDPRLVENMGLSSAEIVEPYYIEKVLEDLLLLYTFLLHGE